MPLKNMKNRCTARSKGTGERCQCPAVTGYKVCYHHGANLKNRGGRKKGSKKPDNSGGPAYGNLNGLKHGAYTAKLLPDEQAYFEAIKTEFEEDLGGADKLSASDRLLVFRLATNAAKLTSAVEKGAPPDAVHQLHRMEMDLLRELKTTRATKGGPSEGGNSPAEVIAALLTRVRERGVDVRPMPALASDDNVVEAEIVDNGGSGDGG